MGRRRGLALLIALLLLLGGALAVFSMWPAQSVNTQQASAPVDKLFDKLGVTQRLQVADWLESGKSADLLDPNTVVWVSRHGHVIHSVPICGGMTTPVQHTLGEALDLGYSLCPVCW